jgi:hypothetical protein
VIGFDVVDPAGGGMRFPGRGAPATPVGLEFVLQLDSGQARVLATPTANPYRVGGLATGAVKRDRQSKILNWAPGMFAGNYNQSLNEPFESTARHDGRFDAQWVAINRARVGSDSTNYLAIGYDRGVLPAGPLPDGAWEAAPWAGAIEFRIPWNLINVTDPSSRHVVHERPGEKSDDVVGTTQVDAIRIVAAAQDSAGVWRAWPASARQTDAASFTWPTWDEPRFQVRRRAVFDAMRTVYSDIVATHRKLSKP